MRTAAGILMVFFGMTTVFVYVSFLNQYGLTDNPLPPLALTLFIIDSAVFVTTAGVFCLTRRYWKICFASSLLLFLFMIYGWFSFPPPLALLLVPGGILPVIFICLRKREWEESWA
jgi:hypothetical protein